MLKQKLQYFGHLRWRANSLEKTVMVGKIEGRRRGNRGWDGWMASPIQWTWVWANSGNSEGQGNLACCSPWGGRVGHNWVTEQHHYCVCVCVSVCVCTPMLSHVWLFVTPMDCSPPGSSVHWTIKEGTLERVAISFSRGSSWPRDWTCISCVSCIGSWILYHWANWESP